MAALSAPNPQTSPSDERSSQLKDSQENETTSPRLTATSIVSYLKSTADAAQNKINPALKELSKAEDAADAYLNKLGASFGQLLKDVVTIAPPESSLGANQRRVDVLFDTSSEKKQQIQ